MGEVAAFKKSSGLDNSSPITRALLVYIGQTYRHPLASGQARTAD